MPKPYPGCLMCDGTGKFYSKFYVPPGPYECPDCRDKELAQKDLSNLFGPAVLWIVICDTSTYGWLYENMDGCLPPYFIATPMEEDREFIGSHMCFLGVDGTGNLVETIDPQGQVFNLKTWLEEI